MPTKIPRAKSKPEELFALHLKAEKIGGWLRELKFSESRKWRVDFVWPKEIIAVEIQGGTHSKGRHVRGAGYEGDCEKLNALNELGYMTFWFTSAMVKDGRAIDQIKRVLGK